MNRLWYLINKVVVALNIHISCTSTDPILMYLVLMGVLMLQTSLSMVFLNVGKTDIQFLSAIKSEQ